jgi:hypothetical protein
MPENLVRIRKPARTRVVARPNRVQVQRRNERQPLRFVRDDLVLSVRLPQLFRYRDPIWHSHSSLW